MSNIEKRLSGPNRRAVLGMAGAGALALASRPAFADPVKLQFWDMIWGPPAYIDAAKSLVDQFNKVTTPASRSNIALCPGTIGTRPS